MRFVFIRTNTSSPWGGSDELWSKAALRLADQGVVVTASVPDYSLSHPRLLEMKAGGIEMCGRPATYPTWDRVIHRLRGQGRSLHDKHLVQMLKDRAPSLVIVSGGGPRPPIDALEICVGLGVPFAVIAQANNDAEWLSDDLAPRYAKALSTARRYYFVSNANWRLAERQNACRFLNAEVVHNPFNVPYDATPSWPRVDADAQLNMACVARLHPPSKGQDLLLEVLAGQTWAGRNWKLSLYGKGPNEMALKHLVEELDLTRRVMFCGHTNDIPAVWSENHVLLLPSRYEGLPLALVEAMLCGRPAVATNVAGNSEILEENMTGFLAASPTTSSIGDALERMWQSRAHLQLLGVAAAASIRERVPPDPVGTFVEKLKQLVPTAANDS